MNFEVGAKGCLIETATLPAIKSVELKFQPTVVTANGTQIATPSSAHSRQKPSIRIQVDPRVIFRP